MNARRLNIILAISLIFGFAPIVCAQSERDLVRQGNGLYNDGNFGEAMKKYDEALVENPQAMEPKFNKADSFYRLDDLEQAIDLYKQVAAESKNMKLVTGAKYNLGNCYFQQGCKQRDSNLQKAIEDLKTSIGYWRGALDIDAGNEKAARNIEVARLTIKDMIDQMKKQQENQKQDPNQSQQEQQEQQQQENSQKNPNKPQDPNQQKKEGQQDPNKEQEPNQPQEEQQKKEAQSNEPNEANEPNKPQQQQAEQKEQPQEQQAVPDTTAQEILDKEQKDKKERQRQQNAGYQKVDKDW